MFFRGPAHHTSVSTFMHIILYIYIFIYMYIYLIFVVKAFLCVHQCGQNQRRIGHLWWNILLFTTVFEHWEWGLKLFWFSQTLRGWVRVCLRWVHIRKWCMYIHTCVCLWWEWSYMQQHEYNMFTRTQCKQCAWTGMCIYFITNINA